MKNIKSRMKHVNNFMYIPTHLKKLIIWAETKQNNILNMNVCLYKW